ncbi:MAG: MFS transporter [Patescibacteria group bacterium]
MASHLRHYLSHYFALHPTTEMKEMFWATAVRSFAVSAVGVFEPIYLYQLGISIQGILLFYIAHYLGYLILTPLGGRICRKHGYEQTILLSSPFLILYYVALFAIPQSLSFMGIALLALVIHKILYWPSFHANFATWLNSEESGREVSNRFAITATASALAPFVGAVIVVMFGFGALFVIASIMVLLSNLPLLRTPEFFLPTKFSYSASVKRFVAGFGSNRFWAMFGFGEQLVSLVLWPIFIVIMIPNLLSVGALVSLAKFVDVLITLYVGRLSDEDRQDNVLHSGTIFTAASWLLRPIVTGPLGIFLIDSYYRVSRNMIVVPYFSYMYKDAKNDGIMASVVFNEMSLAIGKITMATMALVAFWLVPNHAWSVVFVLAAGLTATYSFMPFSDTWKRRQVAAPAAVEHPGG